MADQPTTLSDQVRQMTHGVLTPIARLAHQAGIHPDTITIIGTLLVGIAALAIISEHLLVAGVIVLIGLPLDALDGAVARLRGPHRPFGAFFDSTLDRYADGMLFGALAIYGSQTGSDMILGLAIITMIGAFLISYTRARAEGLGLDCKIGLLSRFERTVILLALLFTGWVHIGLWVLAIGTHFTALQRIWYVHGLTQAPAVSSSDSS
ncbi:MAG: CDP-alcohol phosphatidyltransferase family protein [Chloroflexi bacterium]|nr:CDP-alcohol phosphatidyltransferase family protein [Chloroflexota bacterium]